MSNIFFTVFLEVDLWVLVFSLALDVVFMQFLLYSLFFSHFLGLRWNGFSSALGFVNGFYQILKICLFWRLGKGSFSFCIYSRSITSNVILNQAFFQHYGQAKLVSFTSLMNYLRNIHSLEISSKQCLEPIL